MRNVADKSCGQKLRTKSKYIFYVEGFLLKIVVFMRYCRKI